MAGRARSRRRKAQQFCGVPVLRTHRPPAPSACPRPLEIVPLGSGATSLRSSNPMGPLAPTSGCASGVRARRSRIRAAPSLWEPSRFQSARSRGRRRSRSWSKPRSRNHNRRQRCGRGLLDCERGGQLLIIHPTHLNFAHLLVQNNFHVLTFEMLHATSR